MKELRDTILSYTPLTEAEMEDVLSKFKVRKFKKNTVVESAGQTCRHLYFIEKGLARLYYERDGKDITGWFSIEGDFITANDSFFQKKTSFLNLEVLEDSTAHVIHVDDLELLFDRYHAFERFGRLLTYHLLNTLSERMYSILFQPAEKRYQLLMVHYPEVLMRAPLGDIASFLGISQETLSRIRAQKASRKMSNA